MPESGVVLRLAEAVGDGQPVRWDAVPTLAATPNEQRQLEQLRAIALLAADHRFDAGLAPSAPTVGTLVWGLVLASAAFQAILGLAGAVTLGNARHFRYFGFDALIAAAFLLVSAMLFLASDRDDGARSLSWIFLFAAAAFGKTLVSVSGLHGGVALSFAVRGLVPEAFRPYAQWRFASQFPRTVRFSRFDWWAPRLVTWSAALGVFLFAASLLDFFLGGRASTPLMEPLLAFSRASDRYWFWYADYSVSALAIAASAWRVRRADRDERRRVWWFIGALTLGVGPLFILTASLALFESTRAFFTVESGLRRVIEAIVLGFLLSTPFTTAYVVVTKRSLSLRLVVRQSLRYALAQQVLTALIVLPLAVPVWQAFRLRDRRVEDVIGSPAVVIALLMMAVGVVLLASRRPLMAWADRVLGYARADLARDLAAGSEALGRSRSGGELTAELVRQVQRALGVQEVVVLLRNRLAHFVPVAGSATELSPDSAVAALLGDASSLVIERDTQLFELLPSDDRRWLLENGFELLARIAEPGTPAVGVVAVGRRRHGFAYTPDDEAFLVSLATTTGMALRRLRAGDSADVGFDGGGDEDLGALECSHCGAVGNAPCQCGAPRKPSPLPTRVGGKIDVVRRLGSGGMGVVYLGRDSRLNREVALKTLPRASKSSVEAMLQEARTMALVEHPNLALILDMETWRGTPVLVVEYLAGGTLHDRLAANGPLPPGSVMDIAAGLSGALDALHAQGVLHRDVKPSNVGFTRAGVPKLLDFGVASLLDRDAAHETTAGGTPLYMSPELLAGGPPGPADDVWALALVLMQALSGVHPFAGRTVGEIQRRMFSRPCTVFDDSTLQEWFFTRALNPERTRRPECATTLVRELRDTYKEMPR